MPGALEAVDGDRRHAQPLGLDGVADAGALVDHPYAVLGEELHVGFGARPGGLHDRHTGVDDRPAVRVVGRRRDRREDGEVDPERLVGELPGPLDLAGQLGGGRLGERVMIPSPPASETAAASSARPTHIIPPWTMGCSMPSRSVNRVRSRGAGRVDGAGSGIDLTPFGTLDERGGRQEAVPVGRRQLPCPRDDPGSPPSYWLTYCRTPPVQAGKPMPWMEPTLASATLVSTPLSRQSMLSRASAKSMRSWRSRSGRVRRPEPYRSRTPGQMPSRLPESS